MSLSNSGTINGAVSVAAASLTPDTILNTGLIVGTINLGDGADSYDGQTGRISGAVNMGAGDDTYLGGDYLDLIASSVGNDTFDLGARNDVLVAAAGDGNDTAEGGLGIDTYNAGAVATSVAINLEIETARGSQIGADSISSFENVIATVSADVVVGDDQRNVIDGRGGGDTILGRGGRDVILGGLGNDSLNGGALADVFVFNTALNATSNKDNITDFTSADDTIMLENTGANVFNALTALGGLAATAFQANTTGAAAEADDRIIYNTATGDLFLAPSPPSSLQRSPRARPSLQRISS